MEVRLLEDSDKQAILTLCAQDPLANIFVANRVYQRGVDRYRLGVDMLGGFDDGRLVSMIHVGANIVPVGLTEEMIEWFLPKLGPYRYSNSLMGPARQVLPLFTALSERFPRAFSQPRDIRARQPLLRIDEDPAGAFDPRVQLMGERHFDAYFEAAVQMYTEEVGVSPLTGDDSYALHVLRLLKAQRAMGIAESRRVIFKSDIGTEHQQVCQIQGVWLDPALRGQGLSAPAMAAVVVLARQRYETVSLYVNDFNAPALALYRRVGFEQVGEFATVLY